MIAYSDHGEHGRSVGGRAASACATGGLAARPSVVARCMLCDARWGQWQPLLRPRAGAASVRKRADAACRADTAFRRTAPTQLESCAVYRRHHAASNAEAQRFITLPDEDQIIGANGARMHAHTIALLHKHARQRVPPGGRRRGYGGDPVVRPAAFFARATVRRSCRVSDARAAFRASESV